MAARTMATKSVARELDHIGRLIVQQAELHACYVKAKWNQTPMDAIYSAIHAVTYRLQGLPTYERLREALRRHLVRRFVNKSTGTWKAPRPNSGLDRRVQRRLKELAIKERMQQATEKALKRVSA